jgi:hypothetical protein
MSPAEIIEGLRRAAQRFEDKAIRNETAANLIPDRLRDEMDRETKYLHEEAALFREAAEEIERLPRPKTGAFAEGR